jgi:hypothetical protein
MRSLLDVKEYCEVEINNTSDGELELKDTGNQSGQVFKHISSLIILKVKSVN